jgi:hypothetical protein
MPQTPGSSQNTVEKTPIQQISELQSFRDMASSAVSRLEVLGLYRQLLRHGRRFSDYNFRCA